LQVIAPSNLDTQTMTFDPDQVVKTIGGPVVLPPNGKSLQLRILIDHSLVEVFTEFGQTLTTRVYRAEPPEEADRRLHLFSLQGDSSVSEVEVYKLRSIWSKPEDVPEPTNVY
jgi:sucrose-6-phosphate hydrolase SacC (GH32 family)